MDFLGIIIGTAVLWGLTYGIALPLAKVFAGGEGNISSALPSSSISPNQNRSPSMNMQTRKHAGDIDRTAYDYEGRNVLAPADRKGALTSGVGKTVSSVEGKSVINNPKQTEKNDDAIDSVSAGAFVLAHVLILGVAGLLLGALFGIYFIGFSTKAKMWPGMIALIIASIIGSM